MAKQLNIDLNFRADTSQAISTLNTLKQNLSTIASTNLKIPGLSNELKTAVASAQALQHHLTNAFNIKTGNLDLSRLNASLQQSGASLSSLSSGLLGAGVAGEKAFLQLHSSIASANTQLIKSQGLLSGLFVTLKNTAKWQISSMVLHGFINSITTAYNYAQDLNESLNNIRIVTGYNAEYMAKFADEANRAAKALSTTTTAYTNASLIYFQQGLDDQAVKERTDVTIKMANVTGQSAEIVSDQMTAVWNNFYDGSKSLEYYADAMTALGAATASSTDEISQGLEKFASVAETVGLSYEYATAALATVTATTRQSADVVGTAFKTLFARLNDLKLGETLDDGTTLGTYTENLAKVGVNIKTASGELKDMDQILEETAAKWKTLDKDQQVALAKGVAGIRQYNQFIALMSNWDFMEENLETVEKSGGTLQSQADIYEESWEAASKRVRASMETIYKELIPEDTFIGLLGGIEKVVEGIGAAVKAFGGLEGIILLISSVLLTKFTPAIGQGLQVGIDKITHLGTGFKQVGTYLKDTFAASFKMMTSGTFGGAGSTQGFERLALAASQAKTHIEDTTTLMQKEQQLSLEMAANMDRVSNSTKIQINTLRETNKLTDVVKYNSRLFTNEVSKQLAEQIEQVRVLGEKRALLEEEVALTQQSSLNLQGDVMESFYANGPLSGELTLNNNITPILTENIASLAEMAGLTDTISINIDKATNSMTLLDNNTDMVTEDYAHIDTLISKSVSQITQMTDITSQLNAISLDKTFGTAEEKAKAMRDALSKTTGISSTLRSSLESAIKALENKKPNEFRTILNRTNSQAKELAKSFGVSNTNIKQAVIIGRQQFQNTVKTNAATQEYNRSLEMVKTNIQGALSSAAQIGPIMAQGFSNFSSVAMGINTVSNAIDTLSDSSASFSSKLVAVSMAGTMGFRALMIVVQGMNSVLTALNSTQAVYNTLSAASVVLSGKMTAEQAKETLGAIAQLAVTEKLEKEQIEEMLITELGVNKKKASAMATLIKAGAEKTDVAALEEKSAAEAADVVVTNAGTGANLKFAASLWSAYWPMVLIVAILAVIIALYANYAKQQAKNIENHKTAAEEASKLASAAREENAATEELIKTYEESLKVFEETGEAKEDLEKNAYKVIEALGMEDEAVKILSGSYEELNKVIKKGKIQQNNKEILTQKGNIKAEAIVATDLLEDSGIGKTNNNGRYSGTFNANTEDKNFINNVFDPEKFSLLSLNDQQGLSFDINSTNPEQLTQYIQELQTLYQDLNAYSQANPQYQLEKSLIYSNILSELKALGDSKDKLLEGSNIIEDLNLENLLYGSFIQGEDGTTKGIDEIENAKDYQKFKEQLIKDFNLLKGISDEDSYQWEENAEKVQNYLNELGKFNDFELENAGFQSLQEKGIDTTELEEYYNSLSEEEKEIFWTASIDENTSIESLENYIETAQKILDDSQPTMTIKTQNQVAEAWDKKDFIALEENWNEEDFGMSYEDFLKLSIEDANAFIEKITKKNTSGLKQKLADVRAGLEMQADYSVDSVSNYETQLKDQRFNTASLKVLQKEASNELRAIVQPVEEENYTAGVTDLKGLFNNIINYSNQHSGKLRNSIFTEDNLKIFGEIANLDMDLPTGEYIPTMNGLIEGLKENPIIQAMADSTKNTDNPLTAEDIVYRLQLGLNTNNPDDKSGTGNRTAVAESLVPIFKQVMQTYVIGDSSNGTTPLQNSFGGMINESEYVEGELQTLINGATLIAGRDIDDVENLTNQERLMLEDLELEQFYEELKQVGISEDEIKEYEEVLKLLPAPMKNNIKDLKQFALAMKKVEKGASDLGESFNDLKDQLKSDDIIEQTKALLEFKTILNNLTGIDTSNLTLDFFTEENLALLQDFVTNKNIDSFFQLQENLLKNTIKTFNLSEEDLQGLEGEINTALDYLELNDLEIGTSFDSTGLAAGFDNLLKMGGVTVDQMNSILSGINFVPKIEYQEMTLADAKKSNYKSYIIDSLGNYVEVTSETNLKDSSKVWVPTINAKETVYKGPPTTQFDSSGGGSKPTLKKKTDTVKRYKEVEDAISNNQKLQAKNSSLMESLYGDERIAKMKENIKLMKDENNLLQKKINLAQKYKQEDLDELNAAAAEAGVSFEFNPDGTIKNYTEIMTALHEKWNAGGGYDENETKIADRLKAAIEQYDETLGIITDLEQEKIDKQNEIYEQNYQILQDSLEKKRSLIEEEQELIDFYISLYDKDFRDAEKLVGQYGKQAESYNDLYNAYVDNIYGDEGFLNQYINREIDKTKFHEGMVTQQSDFITLANDIMSAKEALEDFYSNTLSKAEEEISIYADSMSHLNSVMDHYSNVLDLVGQEQNYALKGKILDSKVKNTANELEVATSKYNAIASSIKLINQELSNPDLSDEQRKILEKNLQDAQTSLETAEDEMLSKTEEWAEAIKAAIENELADFGKQLEETLTGDFRNFDAMNTAMERKNDLQEEYLTTTNKIYETNKLMRQAQQEIDKTTNTVAKNRMKQFINETQQLQNQNKLSQYELDIQQAKYDLLLAEIALEEAQNAKSTVRLQRDAEGNFGYIYTADSSKIADAEQKLADAQNALYNKGLEGANDYNQKYAETMSEMYDTLTELQTQYLEGAFNSEQEYQDAMTAAKEYYYQKLEDYSSLHVVALSTDSRVIADAWSTDFNEMVYSTEKWKTAVDDYSIKVGEVIGTWTEQTKEILEKSGLNKLDQNLGSINQKSEELTELIVGEDGLINAFVEQVKNVKELDDAYTSLNGKLNEVLQKLADIAKYTGSDWESNLPEQVEEKVEKETKENAPTEEKAEPQLTVGGWVTLKSQQIKFINGAYGASWLSGASRKVWQINGDNVLVGDANGITGWISKSYIEGFDTGGYTGDWGGSYGKLAMLHKKELVLEPGDTQNFLMSMEILDRIVSAIDLYSMNAQLGGLLNSPTYSGSNSPETLEQNVHIEASFPGITEHNELEIALTDLINQASQYANRK